MRGTSKRANSFSRSAGGQDFCSVEAVQGELLDLMILKVSSNQNNYMEQVLYFIISSLTAGRKTVQ